MLTLVSQPRRVLIVLPQWVHMMDVAGPAQAFTNAAEVGGSYRVEYVADTSSVLTHQGIPLAAPTEWPDLEPSDLVIVPGWKTTRTRTPLGPSMVRNVVDHWKTGGHVASVCAGALLLADAGVLEGQRATTHHDLIDELRLKRGVSVERDVLYTCAQRLHTSAGISSGIDLSLHLITHDHGPALAAKVARALVVPAFRGGAESQRSFLLEHRDHMDDVVHRAQDILDDPGAGPVSLAELGRRVGVSGRTLARHFVHATGMTPQKYATRVRQDRFDALVAAGWSRERAAHAVGYADARSLRRRIGDGLDADVSKP